LNARAGARRRGILRKLLFLIPFVLIPSSAFAWGPLTHVYLGSEIFYLSSLLPGAVYGLINKFRQDYLYGNMMADMILAKQYLPYHKHPHSWEVAAGIMEAADTEAERAFSLGYMSHLAADTVAHGRLTRGARNLRHTFLELSADRLVASGYWSRAVAIDRKVQLRGDAFLERSLESFIFSFNTNKRIFKGLVFLSGLNKDGFGNLAALETIRSRRLETLKGLHAESLDRIVDVLSKGEDSEVLKKDPIGKIRGGKVLKAFLS
jgi:hypothetical protein